MSFVNEVSIQTNKSKKKRERERDIMDFENVHAYIALGISKLIRSLHIGNNLAFGLDTLLSLTSSSDQTSSKPWQEKSILVALVIVNSGVQNRL
jgi:hypothetical protein